MSTKINFAATRKTVTVEIPDAGESLTLLALSLREFNLLKEGGETEDIAELLARSIVDENRQRIYTTPEDVDNLREMSVGTMKVLTDALNNLHLTSKQAQDETLKN